MPEINFVDYLQSKQWTYVDGFIDEEPKIGQAAMIDLFNLNIPQSGIENSVFWPVLAELERQTSENGFAAIDDHTVNFASFGQNNNFVASDFTVEEMEDVAFLHFTRNILTDYSITYDDVIGNATEFSKLSDLGAAFHQDNDFF